MNKPPLFYPQPTIDDIIPLHGVGRIPQEIDRDLCLVTYVDATKTYDYRRIDHDGAVVWRHSFPSGGYSAVAYSEASRHICGPTNYHAYLELDWDIGAKVAEFDLGRRIRSTPMAVDGGDFVAAVGNRVHRFSGANGVRFHEYRDHVFFGQPGHHGDAIITAGAQRAGGETFTVVCAVDLETLRPRWTARIGRGFVPSADMSGITLSHGRVYVNVPGAVTAALDAATGEQLWRTTLPTAEREPVIYRCRPAVIPGRGGSAPDRLVVTSLQGEVFCLAADTGELIWRAMPDHSAGIWSTALVTPHLGGSDSNPTVVVHSGVFLIGLSPVDGSIFWTLPVGFDAYTEPISTFNGRMAVCGGDPPNDGYLIIINPVLQTSYHEKYSIDARYRQGHSKDHLRLSVTVSNAENVSADLRMFGRSDSEQFRADVQGVHVWQGAVSSKKRLGDATVFARVFQENSASVVPIYVDTGAGTRPTEPRAWALDPEHMPKSQPNRTDSGGVVLAAVAGALGRDLSAEDAEDAATWIRELGIDPHFVWRGGTERMLMSSQYPLPEALGSPLKNPEKLIDAWESNLNPEREEASNTSVEFPSQ